MKLEDYKHLIAKAPFGYAYHKILLDDTGKPIDYEFIDINPAFERITGLESSQILHRKATEILSNREEAWSRIPVYGDIALHGGEKEFELYSEWNAKWYKVQIYSPEKNYFVTIYNALHSIDKTTRVRSKIPDVIDISNIKHTEEALRESEERLQLLLNSTPDIICFKDAQGRWLVANKADLELFSLTAVDYIGKTDMELADFTHPVYKEAFLTCAQTDEKAWAARRPCQSDETIPLPDGSKKIYDVMKVPLFYPNGERRGLAVLGHDITERKLAEEALRDSQMRYKTLFEGCPHGILVADLDHQQILYANPSICYMTGYTEAELTNSSIFLLHPMEERSRVKEEFEALSRGQKTTADAIAFLRKDGIVFYADVAATLAHISGYDCLMGFFTDVTERKKAEEELKKAKSYISNIINSMPSVIIGVDVYGKVTQWNWEAERKTGLASGEAIGNSLEKVIPRLAGEMEKVRRAIMARERQTDPKRSYQENGEIFYEDITVYPLVANGVEGAVIRIDDVTDRVRLEEMMVQSEKMLSVGGLAAGMAHEINNPLAGIIQNVCNIENRLSDLHMPANLRSAELAGITMEAIHTFMESRGILRMVRNIKESGSRVAGIVENMLSFARKSEFAISPQNISDLLEKTLELAATDYDLKKQYDFKSIQIIKEYEENLPLVPCEASKIQQVFLNILSNGAQAMHGNIVKQKYFGEKFSPPCFILRLKKESNMLCIEMEDNGPGIEESIRKRIFEPFFTTKPAGAGTGLGLSVSYFIITETHGGSMSVESEAGNGTKFIIRLPLNKTGNML